MGNRVVGCNVINNEEDESGDYVNRTDFKFLYPIGKCSLGKIWRVESKLVKGQVFAIKKMKKARVMTIKSVPFVMNELKLLAIIKS
jgi:hypothetical protein